MSFTKVLLQASKNISVVSTRAIYGGNVREQRMYTIEEKNYILEKIKEKDIPKKTVSELQLKKISNFIEKKGLKSLEDLLNVSGIGPKMLRKMCDRILEAKDGSVSETLVGKSKCNNLLIPKLSEDVTSKLVNVVSVQVGTQATSWSLVDSIKKTLVDWNFIEFKEEKANMFHYLRFTEQITSSLPNGDIYVLENPVYGRQYGDQYTVQMTAMLLAFIQATRSKEDEKAVSALLNFRAKGMLYKGVVGSERVSLQQTVEDMLEERSTCCSLYVGAPLKERFYQSGVHLRECLSQALLLNTAFIDIVINKRINNLSSTGK